MTNDVAVRVRATYDAVASEYAAQLGDELAGKPLDRALLQAFVELAGSGTIADVGCGPGHVTRFLAARHDDVIGIDLSARMIDIARAQAPKSIFVVGSMLDLPAADDAWSGAVALYSIIHLPAEERVVACHEFARAVRPGGWLLVAFHIDAPGFAAGDRHLRPPAHRVAHGRTSAPDGASRSGPAISNNAQKVTRRLPRLYAGDDHTRARPDASTARP